MKGKILLVDDHQDSIGYIADRLEYEGYDVVTATCGADAILEVGKTDFDVIVLDVHMPRMSGIETCKKVKAKHEEISVIFLADDGSMELDGLESGGDEYLVKPVTAAVIECRIAKKIQDKAKVRNLRTALHKWKTRASVDALTGTRTRTHLQEIPDLTMEGGVIMVDVDHFKIFNDTFGHQAGDDCLCNVAAVLLATGYTVIRMGGEEFLVIVHDKDPKEVAESLVETICHTVKNPEGESVTVSAGAVKTGGCCILNDAIGSADKLLYESKREGRNRSTYGGLSDSEPDGTRRRFRDRTPN